MQGLVSVCDYRAGAGAVQVCQDLGKGGGGGGGHDWWSKSRSSRGQAGKPNFLEKMVKRSSWSSCLLIVKVMGQRA